MVGVIDLEKMTLYMQKKTGMTRESLQDSLLDILSSVLSSPELYEGKFKEQKSFESYILLAATRRAIAKSKRGEKFIPIWERLPAQQASPEEQVLASLELQDLETTLQEVLQELGKSKHFEECHELLQVLLSSDHFVKRIKSGPEKGQWRFKYSELAVALGWKRKRSERRLQLIQQAFLKVFQKR